MIEEFLDPKNLEKFIVNHRIFFDDIWAYAEEEMLDETELNTLIDALEYENVTVVYRDPKEERVMREHSGLSIYMYQTAAMPLLSREEMNSLCETIRRGRMEHATAKEKEEGKAAWTKMIVCNLRLVISIARRMKIKNRYRSMEDLIQEGNIGLIRSLDKYDYTKGNRFSTYAAFWIRRNIWRGAIEEKRVIRIPPYTMLAMYNIQKVMVRFRRDNKRDPTVSELAQLMSMKKERVQECLLALKEPLSLSMEMSDGTARDTVCENTLEDFVYDPTALTLEEEVEKLFEMREFEKERKVLFANMSQLTEKEQYVLWYRYGFHGDKKETCVKVGERMGISKQAVSKIEKNALKKMRIMYNVPEDIQAAQR